MSRKGLLTVGLSLLLGTGLGTAWPGVGVQTVRADQSNQVQAPRWGDQSSEQGEIESPRA
jgi:hypothetical protein